MSRALKREPREATVALRVLELGSQLQVLRAFVDNREPEPADPAWAARLLNWVVNRVEVERVLREGERPYSGPVDRDFGSDLPEERMEDPRESALVGADTEVPRKSERVSAAG